MAKAPTSYAGNLARAVGQGVTFGFGDEIEAGIRSLGSDRSYDEEVADIRKSISEFRDTNPVAAYGSEIAGSIPTGFGLAGLALRGGIKGAAKIGALEGSIYGAGEGEGVTGTATSTALGAGLGAAGGKIAEKAFEGIAPLVGKFMKRTRGSGAEVKGSGNIEMEASPSDRVTTFTPGKYDEFFENMGEEGAGMEFPAVGQAVDNYVTEFDPKESFDLLDGALKSDDYPGYATALRANLDRQFPGDKISVSRIENYSDPRAGIEGRRSKSFFEVDKDDVLFAGSDSERELIIRGPKGTYNEGGPMSVRIEEASPSDLGPMVKEAGSDEFVPLEKKVGAPGTPGVDRSINKPLEDEISVDGVPLGGIDYLPVANALLENTVGAGKKGLTGAQYLARLKNQPSVTDMELEVSGLDKFLAENANRKIPMDDVLDYHVGNSPRIEMIDGGTRHVADQRMFGDESYTAQGKNVGGGYEEIVFRDAKFVGNRDTAPGAMHAATHHTNVEGGIGHGRMTSFDDVATGGERSTMLEENQSDLWSIYKGKNRPDEGAQKFVQLTPEKVKSFKAIDKKIEDGAQYRTLNDALTNVDDQKRMLQKIKEDQRTVTADLDGVRKRNFLQKDEPAPGIAEDSASPEFRFAGRLSMLARSDDISPADVMGREMRIEADLGNIIKQAVIEDTRALETLSNDQISKVLRLAADRSMRQSSDTSIGPSFVTIARAPLRDDELKQILDIPEAITGAEEDVLQASYRLISNVQSEFKGIFDKGQVVRELGGPSNALQAVQTAKNLLPKAVNSIDPKLLRKDAADFKRLSSENDLFKESFVEQGRRFSDAKDRVMNIYGDAIEDAAPNKQTAFEYAHYRQNQGKLAIDGGRFNTMATRFAQDPIDFSDGSAGFQDVAPEFTNPLPFETQDQVARYQLHQMIKKAADDGSTRFYIPDYRDLAAKRDLDVTDDDSLAAYVSRYKTPQEKVVKELKQKYPGIDIGTVDTVQPAVNRTPLRDNQATKDYMLEIERPEHDFPMTYIDLTPLQAKPSQVRRYKRGGKVDMRSGIGDLFKVYS